MKNLKTSVMALLILSLGIYSCTKEQINPNITNSSNIVNHLKSADILDLTDNQVIEGGLYTEESINRLMTSINASSYEIYSLERNIEARIQFKDGNDNLYWTRGIVREGTEYIEFNNGELYLRPCGNKGSEDEFPDH